MTSVHESYVAALAALHNPAKNQKADTGRFAYGYADLASILDLVRPVFAEHGLAVFQNVTVDDGNGEVLTTVLHTSGERLDFGPIRFRASGDWQALGSGITYARRYALTAAVGIAPDEDDDANSVKGVPVASKPKSKPQPDRRQQLAEIEDPTTKVAEPYTGDPDPWAWPVDPETGETASLRPQEALVEHTLGGVKIDPEKPLRTPVMHKGQPSEKSLNWAKSLVSQNAAVLGVDEIEYLNAHLVDLGFPEVEGWEFIGQRACSKVIDTLKDTR